MGHHHHQRQPKEAASDDEPEVNARVNAVKKRREIDEATARRANATFARFAGRKISEKEKALRKESMATASREFTAATAAARQGEEENDAAIKAAAEAAASAPRIGLPPADLRHVPAAAPSASMIPSQYRLAEPTWTPTVDTAQKWAFEFATSSCGGPALHTAFGWAMRIASARQQTQPTAAAAAAAAEAPLERNLPGGSLSLAAGGAADPVSRDREEEDAQVATTLRASKRKEKQK